MSFGQKLLKLNEKMGKKTGRSQSMKNLLNSLKKQGGKPIIYYLYIYL